MANRERAQRAKIFAPFDALRGFHEALESKEHIVVPKSELSEEMKAELDWKLRQITIGCMITVIYFHRDEYIKLTGVVSKYQPESHLIQIINTKIAFEDIYDIQGEGFTEEFSL